MCSFYGKKHWRENTYLQDVQEIVVQEFSYGSRKESSAAKGSSENIRLNSNDTRLIYNAGIAPSPLGPQVNLCWNA